MSFGVQGNGGRVWWDDLRIDASPTLNVIRRASLPLAIVGADGLAYTEGVDFDSISDPKLGAVIWPGNYGTHHAPPTITVPAGSRISSGEEIYFSGYHAMPVRSGEQYASMSDAGVHSVMDAVIREAEDALYPDGYLINYSEIRAGGWEPDEVANYSSTGEVLAASIAETANRVDTLTGYKPLYVWSDMFNPYQNAVEYYYHVNNTLEGSWLGLPMNIGVMNWAGSGWGGFHHEKARDALQFFEERGHEQIVAAYYDENVIENYRGWMAAADGVSNVTGVMYTTWNRDGYSDLELFARTWWDGGRNQLVGGGRLYTGDSIQAEGDAACRLLFQTDGNLVAYASGEAYWSAGTQAAARGGWAAMQGNGDLVVYDAAGLAHWSTRTGGNPGARLVIENDCNVMVRASDGAELWPRARITSVFSSHGFDGVVPFGQGAVGCDA